MLASLRKEVRSPLVKHSLSTRGLSGDPAMKERTSVVKAKTSSLMRVRGLMRSRLFWVVGAAVAVLLLYLAFAVFGVQTLLYDREVNEDFAAIAPAAEEQAPPDSTSSAAPEQAAGSATVVPVRVSSGEFHAVAHPGTGDAIVYRLEDGSHVLRLENLDIFNGPALYVYAVAADDANDNATVLDAGFLDLGPLKGNQGNQTYELPPDFDPEKHRSVSVWCERFSVNFATAPLR
jgi:hypothetical protein